MPNADKVLLLGVDGKTAATAANPLPVTTETSGSDQPISDGSAEDTTGTITTPTGAVTATNLDGYSTVTMSISGTYAAFTAVFEQSDDGGVSWFSVDMDRTGSGIVENGCINLTNASLLYRGSTSGSDSFRIRATALTSGTVSVRMSVTAMPTASGVALTTNFTDLRPDSGNITIQDTGSSTATGQNSASLITGTPTVGSTFSYAINGVAGVYVLVTGTWTGTLQYEKSIDGGTTWTPTSFHIDSTAYTQVAITANCSARGASAGATNLRVRATAAMTGTAVVRIVFAAADTVTTINNAARLFDNTTGQNFTIKAASTAPLATDPAIVVAVPPGAGQIAKAEDSASADGDVGIPAMAIRKATPANTSGTDGDYEALQMSTGHLWTYPEGPVASGVADAGNPVKVGGVYYSSKATATTGQRLDLTLSGTGGVVVGAIAVPADGAANNSTNLNSISSGNSGGFPTQVFPYVYNGTTWDRLRGTTNGVNVQTPYSYSRKTADGQVVGAAGYIHTISIAPTGTVTAGVLTIYDSLTETGTVIYSVSLPVTVFSPFTVTIDAATTTGIFVGFDATLANTQVTVSYR